MAALAQRLEAGLVPARLEAVEPLSFSSLKTASPPCETLVGRGLASVGSRGKLDVLTFEGRLRLAIHLGQSGRVRLETHPAPARPRGGVVRLAFEGPRRLVVVETSKERRAGWWVLGPGNDGPLPGLGPEATGPDAAGVVRSAAASRQLHPWLWDQHVLAGIGRGYADDICNGAGLSPFASVARLDPDERERLVSAIAEVLGEALGRERRREGALAEGDLGDPSPSTGGPASTAPVAAGSSSECPSPRPTSSTARTVSAMTWCSPTGGSPGSFAEAAGRPPPRPAATPPRAIRPCSRSSSRPLNHADRAARRERGREMAEPADELSSAIAELEDDKVLALVRARLDAGKPAMEVVQGLQAGMKVVGDRFESGEYFLNELVVAGEIMKEAMELLEPHLGGESAEHRGLVVIGTVRGDIHDLGKNIVVMLLKGAGYEVVDLGVDVPPERFVEEVGSRHPKLVGMSALLTASQPAMKETIEQLHQAGVTAKIMIGGSYINETIKTQVGADYFGTLAGDAVKIADAVLANA